MKQRVPIACAIALLFGGGKLVFGAESPTGSPYWKIGLVLFVVGLLLLGYLTFADDFKTD
jgi:hypothetical protein